MKKLTFSMENYLEAIYELTNNGKGVRVTDIAERMGVSKASTNNAMSVLSEKGLVINEKYQDVFLTEKGLELAKFTSSKHRVIRAFFVNILGVNNETADTDACAIEHVISSDSVYAMQRILIEKDKSKDNKS
ncbi:MAG: DtxR family iron (metal) dependent repressor [Clostridia bacterium]|nr:DtxR family iron (metal) dependent repressor [Clostridia bacterium]